MKIPEGWKLAPIEPAPEQFEAAFNCWQGYNEDTPDGVLKRDAYKAMLAAAPTPPAQSNQWKEAVLLQCMAIEGCYNENNPIATMNCLIDWHTQNAPTPPAQSRESLIYDLTAPVPLKTPPAQDEDSRFGAVATIMQDVCEAEHANPDLPDTVCINVDDLKSILDDHIKTPPAPICKMCNGHGLIGGFVPAEEGYHSEPCPDCNTPAPEVEPVAWMHDGGTRVDIAHADVKELWLKVSPKRVEHYTIPLYTHPADDGLRKAAGEVVAYFDDEGGPDFGKFIRLIATLRAELDKKS